MPFRNCLARTFKAAAIRREAPASSGVYGLSNAREWIYVGETDNIQARLLEHLEETNTFRTEALRTGFRSQKRDFWNVSAGAAKITNHVAAFGQLVTWEGKRRSQ